MSKFDDVVKYIGEHLRIEVDQITEFGPVETIQVKLFIGYTLISEDYCYLPEMESE